MNGRYYVGTRCAIESCITMMKPDMPLCTDGRACYYVGKRCDVHTEDRSAFCSIKNRCTVGNNGHVSMSRPDSLAYQSITLSRIIFLGAAIAL